MEMEQLKMKISSPEETFLKIYRDLKEKGVECSPRGLKILEIENYSYDIEPYVRFTSFASRNFNLDYIKTEFLWYLKGDRYDLSICDHASIWKNLVQPDGGINSNYGQYVFGQQNQFDFVVNELIKDKDSRRASIVILNKDHLAFDNPDVPCTYSINFRIRKDVLNMSVKMRSQDAIFGMTNDVACFSFIHEMMFNTLKEHYPNLEYGIYNHSVDSFHVYERHFEMLDKIINEGAGSYVNIDCPKISGSNEVDFLRSLHKEFYIPIEYQFTNWLLKKLI